MSLFDIFVVAALTIAGPPGPPGPPGSPGPSGSAASVSEPVSSGHVVELMIHQDDTAAVP